MGREEIKNKIVFLGCLLIFEKEICFFGISFINVMWCFFKSSGQQGVGVYRFGDILGIYFLGVSKNQLRRCSLEGVVLGLRVSFLGMKIFFVIRKLSGY